VIRQPGFVALDHKLRVPLDHARPGGAQIEIFARELRAADKADDDSRPCLLFLQGGPGGASPRPLRTSGWIKTALDKYRVILLDQRGTGRSTPVTAATTRGRSSAEIAEYLSYFRADAIVADAEALRRSLLGDEPWDTLGQSYGGFVTLTYLSQAAQGLRTCFIAGGVPGIASTADDVYRRTYPRVQARTLEFYRRYPDDRAAVRRIADYLDATDVRLPDGDRLTTRRLRFLGQAMGFGDGFEKMHWLLEGAWHGDEHGYEHGYEHGDELSDYFCYEVMHQTAFVSGPIYALQEFVYAQGGASNWAAQREYDKRPEFAESADPLLFTGEMMFPWMFQDIRALRPFAETADLLAARDDWPALYDTAALASNTVPLFAAVYFDDLYVDAQLQLQTIASVGAAKAWVTNEHEHDGLADEHVLQRLLDMAAGRV
jgi:pimeloyl-ACP methyl ester carboxylesterase